MKKSKQQVDWKRTKIRRHRYAHDGDEWLLFEPGDEPPRFDPDDAWDGKFETPARRDRVEGRNRRPNYATMKGSLSGSLSSAMDSLDSQPISVLANFVEKRLRGRQLDVHQRRYVRGLQFYLADKRSMSEVNPATVRGLLTALAQ